MFRLKQFMAVLMLAVWLPSTSHPLLESAGLIHEQHAPASDSNHDAADGFVLLPSTVNAPPMIATLVCVSPEFDFVLPEPVETPRTHRAASDRSPPLPNTWQFVHRAALPARAPSFAS